MTFFLATAVLPAEEKWIKVTSPNFELYTSARQGTARSAVQYFEQVRGFFINAIGMEPKPGKRIRLVGFRGEEGFRRYDEYGWMAAFYQPGVDRDYIVMKSLSNDIYKVAVHEYMHLLVRHTGIKLPTWLNEGIAEFYSTMTPVGKKVRVGEFDPGRYRQLMDSKWLPMEQLVSASQDAAYHDEKERVGVFYAQSWALTHMLMMGDDYQGKRGAFFGAIQSQPGVEAFRSVYAKSMKDLTKDLNAYMEGSRYKVLLFDVPLAKMAETPEIQPIANADANLILARVLMNRGKYAEARELLQGVSAESGNAEQNEVLGYLHLFDKEDAKAVEYFLRASAAGSATSRMYQDLANLLHQAKRHEEAIGTLRAGLKIDPADNDARVWLAVMLINRKRYGEAMSELSQTRSLDPDKVARYYRVLSESYIGLKAWKQARNAANLSVKHASTPSDKEVASRLVVYLNQWEEYEKASAAAAASASTTTSASAPAPISVRAPAIPPPTGDNETPVLRRRPPSAEDKENSPYEIVRTQIRRGEGTFEKLDCAESGPRFHFLIGGQPLVLTVDDPALIGTAGPGGAVDLTCGPQKSVPVAVGWIVEGAPEGTAGLLRQLDFR